MTKIALVTYNPTPVIDSPVASNEDDLLLAYLQAQHIEIEKAVWNDKQVNWAAYDVLLIKSPWDYFDHIAEFQLWLSAREAQGIACLNPIPMLRWNAHKRYLQDIESSGLKVIPTAYLEKKSSFDLNPFFAHWQTDTLIVKPCVSGGSKDTFKLKASDLNAFQAQLQELLQQEDFMVQPYLPQIASEGEWSFIFFNGLFSHCILKQARSGEFRVQHNFGGSVAQPPVSPLQINMAQQYVDKFAADSLYARVDGVYINEVFYLMELELIEPYLFLDFNDKAYDNYLKALKHKLAQLNMLKDPLEMETSGKLKTKM